MNASLLRIEEVKSFFRQKDIGLAFRRLLDCAMDTQDMSIYKEAISLTARKERLENGVDDAWLQQCDTLLEKIASIPLQEADVKTEIVIGDKLGKTYRRGGFSLGPISLAIRKAQVYGLVGENGNGKTTLLRILAKELSFDSGMLQFGFQQNHKDNFDLRTKLVYIPQRTQKWYGSLIDNLKFVLANYKIKPEEIETRVLMMVARLGLWNYKDLQWHQLSSGYKMRFELARTLLRQPEVLLLDEPLANLDILAQQVILEDLKYIANSITHPVALILSSQQLYEVEKVSDRVIFLKNGKYNQEEQEFDAAEARKLIIELEIDCGKEALMQVFAGLAVEHLSYNGGQFVAQFDASVSFTQVLQMLSHSGFELNYIRNISSSSRRFFVA